MVIPSREPVVDDHTQMFCRGHSLEVLTHLPSVFQESAWLVEIARASWGVIDPRLIFKIHSRMFSNYGQP